MKIKKIIIKKVSRPDQLPDVDIDFEAERRGEVKKYIEEKYGYESTCSVGTYTRLHLKSALKDFSRVKGIDFNIINFVTKGIEDWENTWSDLFMCTLRSDKNKEGNKLRDYIQRHSDIVNLIKPVLGQARSTSIHPSALLILPKEDKDGNKMTIFDWIPVKKVDGSLVSEWEGKFIDRAGFLKEDILGLSQLDKFRYIKNLLKKEDKEVELEEIPLLDKKVYKYYSKGFTEDIFQFGSSGLKNYCTKVKPDNIEDIIAMAALYRPGPMSSRAHEDFALIKHGKKKAKFDYMLEGITKHTHGLYVYQEQIMQAVHHLGGLTLSQADEVRTIMKKFDEVKMATFEEQFIAGAIKNKCSEIEAKKIWKKLFAFSTYGFNRSHSAAYGVMSYWSMWFKANYPLEFWTTALHFAKEDKERNEIPNRLSELNRMKLDINIKPPDINKSGKVFRMDKKTNSIYWSLVKIKSVGSIAVDSIIKCRTYEVKKDESGKEIKNENKELIWKKIKFSPFKSLEDFVKRVPKSKVNKKVITHLILAGCFDELERLKDQTGRKELIQSFLLSGKNEIPEEFKDTNRENKKIYFWIFKQKELTGFGDVDYSDMIKKKNKLFSVRYLPAERFLKPDQDWKEAVIAGKVMYYGERNSKNGKFCIMTIENNNNILQFILWNDIYIKYKEKIPAMKGKLIAVSGKIKYDAWRNHNVLFSTEKTELIDL